MLLILVPSAWAGTGAEPHDDEARTDSSILAEAARLRDQGNLESARSMASDVLAEAENLEQETAALFVLGTIDAEEGRLADALERFHQLRQGLEDHQPLSKELQASLARTYSAIGVVHNFADNHSAARRYFERALDEARRAGQTSLELTVLNNLAVVASSADGPAAGARLHRQSLAIAETLNDHEAMTISKANLCNQLTQAGDLEEAEPFCLAALPNLRDGGPRRHLAGLLMSLGDLATARGDLNEALAYYQESLELARDRVPEVERLLLAKLADVHLGLADPALAVNRLKALLQLNEELGERRREDIMAELEVRYAVEQIEAQLENLRLQSELDRIRLDRRNAWLVASAIALVLLLGLASVAIHGYRKERRLERSLAERNQQLEQAVRRVSQLAIRDSLTGLLNRRAMMASIDKERARARRHGQLAVLALGDIDHFKNLNDLHGHQVGDDVLRGVAELLSASLRPEDLLCRWGGEEFLCLLIVDDRQQAIEAIERLRQTLADTPFQTAAGELSVTMSFGLACLDDAFKSSLQAADRALYQAKDGGRNQTRFSETE
ncbi:MAG: diguanylate cyclase [Wenzhouxiangella sp.]